MMYIISNFHKKLLELEWNNNSGDFDGLEYRWRNGIQTIIEVM